MNISTIRACVLTIAFSASVCAGEVEPVGSLQMILQLRSELRLKGSANAFEYFAIKDSSGKFISMDSGTFKLNESADVDLLIALASAKNVYAAKAPRVTEEDTIAVDLEGVGFARGLVIHTVKVGGVSRITGWEIIGVNTSTYSPN